MMVSFLSPKQEGEVSVARRGYFSVVKTTKTKDVYASTEVAVWVHVV